MKKAFRETEDTLHSDLKVIAQQQFLYLESIERPRELLPGMVEARFAKKGGARRTPLGRMVWTGDLEHWGLHLYKWSDECWDADNEAGTYAGTPEDCVHQAVAGW
jgi:hypothetical protein